MQDHHVFPTPRGRHPGHRRGGLDRFDDFARWALALLAARRSRDPETLRADLLDGFYAVATDPDEPRLHQFMMHLVRERVSAAAVADLYIPELARRLGRDWMDDRATFAQVSLATARIQGMLRAIGSAWSADTAAPGAARSLALVVPKGEQHTLGAMVLLGQLRRLGISVRLILGEGPAGIAALVRDGGLQGVLISVSATSRLAEVQGIVRELRAKVVAGLPIVVGGAVVRADVESMRLAGVDLMTADLSQALAACGIAVGAGDPVVVA